MSWDLALSGPGDLLLDGNNDLAGKSGIDLIEQRIYIRLKVWRGSWVYDDSGNFGSRLYRLVSMNPTEANRAALAYVNEALREMVDIVVDTVAVTQQGKNLLLAVNFHVISSGISSRSDISGNVDLAIPVGGSI